MFAHCPIVDLGDGVFADPTGLALSSSELSEARYREIGTKLDRLERGIQWLIGDWYVFGIGKYGARAEAMAAGIFRGRAPQTIANYGSVCRAFSTSRRREALSFGHHEAVASLPESTQESLLDRAVENHWPVRHLREAADLYREHTLVPRTLQIETSEITIPLFRGPLPSTVVTDVLKSIAMVDALKPAEDSARPSLQSPGGSAEAALLTAALRELGAWECRHGLVIDPVAAGHIRQALEAIERQLSAITGQATEEQHLPSERRRLN